MGTSSSSRIQDGWDNVVLLTDDYDEFRSIVRCPLPPLRHGFSMEQGGLQGGYGVVSTAGFRAGEIGERETVGERDREREDQVFEIEGGPEEETRSGV